VTHTFFEVGYYYVHLQVREENGSWGSASLEFAVSAAVPPAAIVGYSPSNPLVGEDVTFDGSSSVDPDGSIVTYIWQLGDGTVATGAQVVHAYAVPGTYEVQLTVIDEDKLIDDGVTKITVVSKPIAGFEHSPASPAAGVETAFYAVGSYDPMGITLYVWSFGDGTYAQGWQVSHTYTAPGDYSVTLTVTNAAGVQATLSKTVSVAAAPLTPTVSNTADLGWEETSELGIEPLILALCAISMAIGCLVGDVLVGFGQRKKGT
jgi:PKD repeat protein